VAHPVIQLADIRESLGGASPATVFRYLRKVPYRRSYNHNGRFYTLHDVAKYDRHGLWSHGDVHFSRDGSLKATVLRMVNEADAGVTHRELAARLQVRVHNTLLHQVRVGAVHREQLEPGFVYFHGDPTLGQAQRGRRMEQLETPTPDGEELEDQVVIEVLLVLIRHPGARSDDVRRHLRGRSPPIGVEQIRAVFSRYDLEKGGASTT